MKVLLIEDEPELANFLKKGFLSEAFEAEMAYDGQIGLSLFQNNIFDIVILDINIPRINGFELCKIFKEQNPRVPVLMLTALDSIQDKISGFGAGADDYLVKPFEFKELLLRMRALTNRYALTGKIGSSLHIADLELNPDTKVVMRAGQLIELTTREYALLEYLMLNKEKIVTRVDIAEKVWDINFDTNTNVIDVYINYLRNKVDKNFDTKLIHTVVGMGYVLREK